MMVLREIFFGNNRFTAIKERLQVADTVLSKRLAGLCEAGLLERRKYDGGQRSRLEYVLTEAGADALPIFNALTLWSEKHLNPPSDQAHMYLLHRDCGQRSNSAERCEHCGTELTARNTSWHSLTRSEQPIPLDLALAGTAQGSAA